MFQDYRRRCNLSIYDQWEYWVLEVTGKHQIPVQTKQIRDTKTQAWTLIHMCLIYLGEMWIKRILQCMHKTIP